MRDEAGLLLTGDSHTCPEGTVLPDSFHGNACLRPGPGRTRRDLPKTSTRPPNYRGCTPEQPRRGVVHTTATRDVVAIRRGRRLAGIAPPPPHTFVTLTLDPDSHKGVPCWRGGPAHWAHVTVAIAYDLNYQRIRPLLCNGGVARRTVILVAAARAHFADYATGRRSRPTNERLARCAGVSVRTVQRADEVLRLLGVATEVLRGRQRTRTERMASWRMGDRSRGWASVWALHDNAAVIRAIHRLSPHPEGSQLPTGISPLVSPSTTHGRDKRAQRSGARRRASPDEGGRQLLEAWRRSPGAPPWCQRHSSAAWAALLAAPAAAGWTPRDLTHLVRDWIGAGHWIADHPRRPIALLAAIVASHPNVQVRPAAADEAREAAELAAHRDRQATIPAQRAELAARRQEAIAALSGPGRAAAQEVMAELARRRHRRPDTSSR